MQVSQKTLANNRDAASNITIDSNVWWIPSFPIIRENSCVFKLWKNVDERISYNETLILALTNKAYHLMAHSDTLVIRGGREKPTLIHLALTSKPSEMMVHFTTGMQGVPIVVYSTNATTGWKRAQGQSTTYTNTDLCQEPASV